MPFNVRKTKTRHLTVNIEHALRQYLYLDYALYEYAVKRYERQVREQGPEFTNEVCWLKRFFFLHKWDSIE